MPRELGVEQAGIDIIRQRGWWQCKVGYDGWPDRLVIWAPGRHFWWEVKTGSDLTPAQRVRIPRMQDAGEDVFLGDIRELLGVLG